MAHYANTRAGYGHFVVIPMRSTDNDVHGHVNNVVYYACFDTVSNEYLIRGGGLDIRHDPVVGYAVETFFRFHRPITFPEAIDAGPQSCIWRLQHHQKKPSGPPETVRLKGTIPQRHAPMRSAVDGNAAEMMRLPPGDDRSVPLQRRSAAEQKSTRTGGIGLL